MKFLSFFLTLITLSFPALAGGIVPPIFQPQKVVTGNGHTCILSTQGQIKCWGNNASGELGVGTSTKHGLLPNTMGKNLPIVNLGDDILAQNICGGRDFTCAITKAGSIKCWGENNDGQLGQEREIRGIGFFAKEMGNDLPFTNLGADFSAKDIQCGENFACALSTTGKVKCWGRGDSGQLGIALTNRTSVGRKKDEMGAKLPYLSLPTPVTQITTGYGHACAVANGKIHCWGSNEFGQAGLELETNRVYLPTTNTFPTPTVKLEGTATIVAIESVQAGRDFTCALYKVSGNGLPTRRKIKCWGRNLRGQLGIGATTYMIGRVPGTMGAMLPEVNLGFSDISQFESHDLHTCATSNQGYVKCWGLNSLGQLGLGDTDNRGTSADQMGSKLPFIDLGLPVKAISSGSTTMTTCAILINNEMKCWGDGNEGALGYEDSIDRGSEENQMGDNLPYVRFK